MIKHTKKHSKIVATIGPASRDKETMVKLIRSGANVFRLNFSHGTHEDHQKSIDWINEINEELGTHVAILQDLQGPKIRVNEVENNGVEIIPGQRLIITTDELLGTSEKVSTSYKELPNDVKVGDNILIDDGNLEVRVTGVEGIEVITEVVYGGILKSRKGINLPNTKVSAPSLTKKDRVDLEFGLSQNVDWVALSFVREVSDILELKEIIRRSGKHTKVIAKIEKPEALKNIDDIINETDAVMVARGDLGVEIPSEQVPIYQKRLILKCNRLGKPVIVATQMMESMVENPRPTRAETNDVANAILDGADAVMLSAESASGKYPVEAVSAMTRTIENVESNSGTIFNRFHDFVINEPDTAHADMLLWSACRVAENSQAKAIVAMSKSGFSGFRVAMHRPHAYIFLVTDKRLLLRQMSLVWGVTGVYYDKTEAINETMNHIAEKLVEKGFLKKGDSYLTTAAMPEHWEGHTNMMRISMIED